MGRPTLYNQEILTKTEEFIKQCEDENIPVLKYRGKDGEESYDHKIRVKLPTIEGLSVHLGIHKDTVYDWVKHEDKKEFSDLIDTLLMKQAERLINNGLSGDYSASIAKVILTKHGYREGIDTTTNNKDISPIVGMQIVKPSSNEKSVPIDSSNTSIT